MVTIPNIRLGIVYIFWIITAWTLVGFVWSSKQIADLDPAIKIVTKELLRFFVFIAPVLLFILHHLKQQWYRWLGLYGCKKGTLFKTLVVAVVYASVSLAINMYGFHKAPHLCSVPWHFWLTAFSLSIIMEEIVFRGFLFYLFGAWNKHVVVMVTALAFAAKHIPGWLLFPAEVSAAGFVGDFTIVFLVGCILGYLYQATHSIWATSIVHSINNLIVVLFNS